MIGIHPLDVPGAAHGLKPADMGTHKSLGVQSIVGMLATTWLLNGVSGPAARTAIVLSEPDPVEPIGLVRRARGETGSREVRHQRTYMLAVD